MSGDRIDFFVSHAGADRAWAEWVAWQLADAGHVVELDVWDWAAGENFVTKISDALDRAGRVVALWSAEYFSRSRYTTEEWSAALAVPGAREGRLVPVRVEDVPTELVPGILRPLLYRDVFGLGEAEAQRVLLEAVAGPARPGQKPVYPGAVAAGTLGGLARSGPRLPGSLPQVWNAPARNLGFTGRDMLLVALRERLLSGERAVVQALHGMGGVGKTQLAIEYAYRFAGGYDLVWWVSAERGGLILEQIVGLAAALRCADPGAPAVPAAQVALSELRGRGRWLLVFDNAEAPGDLMAWLPGGSGGHVLITTRTSGWREIAAAPVEVDVFARPESVAILCDRVPGLPEADAGLLAEELGDLPLGIAQAANYLADSSMPPAEYLTLVRTRAGRVLDQGPLTSYPRSLAGAIDVTMQRLASEDSDASGLARVCAFFAPEPIDLALFPAAASQLPGSLASAAADVLAWRKLLAALGRSSLARIDQDALQMHRLTQAILRDRLPPGRAAITRALARKILAASNPGDPGNPGNWPRWARLLPHILAIGSEAEGGPDVRDLFCQASWYLLMRGDYRGGHDLAQRLHEQWQLELGGDDAYTLWAANSLAESFRQMGRYAEAQRLDEDTLACNRRALGEDHDKTLTSASNLAADLVGLGDHRAARDLDEDTLARKRRVHGEDHPHTLVSASNLAVDLRALGDHQAARDLDEDTLARRRRVHGEDHPYTLVSASHLAMDLSELGDHRGARDLDEDTLARMRRVLGEDHPDTLNSASNLAGHLRALGDDQAARDLDEDTLARRRRVLGGDGHPDTSEQSRH